jgi:nitrile hydratase accessory protein
LIDSSTNLKAFSKESVESEHPFKEPWQAQAFAMAVMLNENGLFSWDEWAAVFSEVLAEAGPNDDPENYYLHWMEALETITRQKGVIGITELLDRKNQWDKAAKATPHGQPILL